MKIQLWSIGRQHESYVKDGIEDFTARLQKYFPAEWLIIPAPKKAASLNVTEFKKQEAVAILSRLQKDDCVILLDEKGKQISSPELAEMVQHYANKSTGRLVFLIGGAYGVDETIFNRANFVWSLSKLVFPHMLVRLILAEQLYRACTILRNEKYHHS